jgi:predicted transposase/invertase (TIGR01784 family)
METDSFFCNLFKKLPQTLFELLGLPDELARWYHFDAVELKKALRIDGLLQPTKPGLPLYFVEVQTYSLATFYANLFAKVFCFLQENDPAQDWAAVAIFSSRGVEPKHRRPYDALLRSDHVHRIYLDELPMSANSPLGLRILQLVSAPEGAMRDLVGELVNRVERRIADSEKQRIVIELVEEILLRRFTQLDREEVRKMFQLHDLRESKVWQEARQTGREEGREEGKTDVLRDLVRKWRARGMSAKEIAELMELPIQTIRRLMRSQST